MQLCARRSRSEGRENPPSRPSGEQADGADVGDAFDIGRTATDPSAAAARRWTGWGVDRQAAITGWKDGMPNVDTG